MTTTFRTFAWPLRRACFRKTWSSRVGGTRVVEWKREEPDGRTLICQLWEDGKNRVSHEWVGCSDTLPTDFTTEAELKRAIEREATRIDSRYREPDNHHAPGAREFLWARAVKAGQVWRVAKSTDRFFRIVSVDRKRGRAVVITTSAAGDVVARRKPYGVTTRSFGRGRYVLVKS